MRPVRRLHQSERRTGKSHRRRWHDVPPGVVTVVVTLVFTAIGWLYTRHEQGLVRLIDGYLELRTEVTVLRADMNALQRAGAGDSRVGPTRWHR